jgi:hypothetical protein
VQSAQRRAAPRKSTQIKWNLAGDPQGLILEVMLSKETAPASRDRHNSERPTVAWAMYRVGVSAPDIAGADESNLPAPESFRSTVAYFESASGPIRLVPAIRVWTHTQGVYSESSGQSGEEHPPAWKQEPSRGQRRSPVI